MQLATPTPEEARAGLRALVTVARVRGAIAQPARALIDAAQGRILGTDLDVDRLEGIEPGDLAAALANPGMRSRLVHGLILVSMASGEASPEQARAVERFAATLGVETPALRALRHLASQDLVLYRLCILRHGQMPDMLRDVHAKDGLAGVARALLGMKRVVRDPVLAARYHALEDLADDTFGTHVWRHYRSNGFAVPGEPGGFPEAGAYHDLSHVLGGYNATPEGEALLGAFIAGYRRRRRDGGFFTLLSALTDDRFADAGAGIVARVAPQLLEAFARGAALPVDLSDAWDFWPYLPLPLDEARGRLGVPPKSEGGHRWDEA